MQIGLLGAFFILSAWIYETYKTYKSGVGVDIKFILCYVIGLTLLTYYSFQIRDITFMFLNGTILSLTLIELDFALRRRHKKRRSVKQPRRKS